MCLEPNKNDSPTEALASPPQPAASAPALVDIDWTPFPATHPTAVTPVDCATGSKRGSTGRKKTPPPVSRSHPPSVEHPCPATKKHTGQTPREERSDETPGSEDFTGRYGAAFGLTEGLLEVNPSYCARPVDFRRQLAVQLANKQRIPRSWLDRSIRRVSEFFERLRQAADHYDLLRLSRRCPRLMAATDLFVKNPPHRRNEVEARLLALQPLEEIDQYMCLPPGTAAWYERVFFTVLDRIQFRGYIAHSAIRLHGNEGDLGAIWRHCGFHGGRRVLDVMVMSGTTAAKPKAPGEVRAFLAADVDQQMMVKTCIAAHQLPCDDKTALRLMRLQAMAKTGTRQRTPTRHELAPSFSENLRVCQDEIARLTGIGEADPTESLVGTLPPPFLDNSENLVNDGNPASPVGAVKE